MREVAKMLISPQYYFDHWGQCTFERRLAFAHFFFFFVPVLTLLISSGDESLFCSLHSLRFLNIFFNKFNINIFLLVY